VNDRNDALFNSPAFHGVLLSVVGRADKGILQRAFQCR
jgi:hypothetical protein